MYMHTAQHNVAFATYIEKSMLISDQLAKHWQSYKISAFFLGLYWGHTLSLTGLTLNTTGIFSTDKVQKHAARRHLNPSGRKPRVYECAQVDFLGVNSSGSEGLHLYCLDNRKLRAACLYVIYWWSVRVCIVCTKLFLVARWYPTRTRLEAYASLPARTVDGYHLSWSVRNF